MRVDGREAGRLLAKRIAFEGGDEADLTVLEDWIAEREDERAGDDRYPDVDYDRRTWWLSALGKDVQATAFALSLGAEDMTGPELREAVAIASLADSTRRQLAERFAKICYASSKHQDRVNELRGYLTDKRNA